MQLQVQSHDALYDRYEEIRKEQDRNSDQYRKALWEIKSLKND